MTKPSQNSKKATDPSYHLVTEQDRFDDIVEHLLSVDRYALDTEFHRERTYFPQVALVQLTAGSEVWLVDPLEVDLAPLKALLEGDGHCIVHAGTQDLEVLELVCGAAPRRLFDTQIAAGFIGVATGSLTSLVSRFLGVHLPKGDRLTDWLRRPLTDNQLRYAASDVDHLHELTGVLEDELESLGRLEWVEEECRLLLARPRSRRLPEEAILRIKEARSLKGQAFKVATAVAAWRERRAVESNVPVRQVLSDLGVVAVAQRVPESTKDLSSLRGVESRHLRNGAASEILSAVQVGLRMTAVPEPATRSPELARHLRPVVTLVTAWVAQLARDNRLDPAILATRADVEALLKDDADCRLLHGWRQEMVGIPIARLVAGEAAVAFDGDGRLVLEARSGQPLIEHRRGPK
jgi:ribonuclease D